MMNNLLLILSISGVAPGSIACCILLFSNSKHKYANRLLALTLFGLVSILLVTFLLEWNADFYAYIYRFPSPLLYTIFPGAYLFLRATVYDETRFRKKDILHFLPVLLYLIEMLPHYFTSYEHRLHLVQEIKNQPIKLVTLNDGLLPPYCHLAFLCVQALSYLVVISVLLQQVRRVNHEKLQSHTARVYDWVKLFVYLTGFIAVALILIFVGNNFLYTTIQPLLVTFTLAFLIITIYLFFQPEILYGISAKKDVVFFSQYNHEPLNTVPQSHLKKKTYNFPELDYTSTAFSNLEIYKPVLESHMQSKTPFLKKGYSIQDLSRETGIPQHHLSALLNRVYKMRFTDYINGLRICYIKQDFGKIQWQNLTLEGIAKHAGFSSRTTFFNAIKKNAGITPSAFLAELKKQQLKFSLKGNSAA